MKLKDKLLSLTFVACMLAHMGYAAEPTIITPSQLKWQPVKEMPKGAEFASLYGNPQKHDFFIAYVKLPANYQVPVHKHPIIENDTVISGTYYLGMGETINKDSAIILPAGSFVSIPKKTYHYGYTKDEVILQITGIGPWAMIYK